MTLNSCSFVLPMYNEVEGIEDTIEEVRIIAAAICPDYEIIISDDASTDGCADIVEKITRSDSRIKLVRLSRNSKFGGALAAGLRAASKDIIIYTDSDLPISLLDIKNSLPLIERADIVTAVSKIRKGDTLKRKIISIGYNTLLRVLFNMNIRDVNSGYKVFRKKIIEGMDFLSESPFIDAEIFLRARKRGGTILEYPLIFRPRKQGVSKVARMSVLFRTFYDMVKYRMAH